MDSVVLPSVNVLYTSTEKDILVWGSIASLTVMGKSYLLISAEMNSQLDKSAFQNWEGEGWGFSRVLLRYHL